MSRNIGRVGVVGAGTMGNGIAQTFAVHGHEVVMRDLALPALEHAVAVIENSLSHIVEHHKLTTEEAKAAIQRIKPTLAMEDFAGCDLIVEAAPERFEIKKATIAELDRISSPDAILATNPSSISITRIAATSKNPSRVIGMHFFNPVAMMELVEIIPALQTSDEVRETIVEVTKALGKSPRLSKDSYGFVVNRVLVPMINEAINCVHEGVASAEDVDQMMKLGAHHPIGPLALADLIGLDVVLEIMETLYVGFDDPKYRPSVLLKQMSDAGYLGRKCGRGFFIYAS